MNRYRLFISCALMVLQLCLQTACAKDGRTGQAVDTADKRQPLGGAGAPAPVPQAAAAPRPSSGTVDGGGGAGFGGKPLESYRKDISKLPEYEAHILPILKSVERIHPEYAKLFLHIVKNRLWLFLNAPVPAITPGRQGSPYNIDQWAVQNSREIWFSDQYRGDDKDRARILLHEILVGLKIMRYLSYSEYCYVIAPKREYCEGIANNAIIENYKLDDLNHQDVRAMTEWLWEHHASMSSDDFGHAMHQHQFQSEEYSWKKYLSSEPFEYDKRPIMNAALDKLMGQTVRLYAEYGADRKAKVHCDLTYLKQEGDVLTARVQYLDILTGQEKMRSDVSVKYAPGKELRSGSLAGRPELSLVSLIEDKRVPQTGGHRGSLNMVFERNALSEVSGGTQIIAPFKNGEPQSSSTNLNDAGNFYCRNTMIEIPSQYRNWLQMRKADREFHERRYYGGKTLEELAKETANEMRL